MMAMAVVESRISAGSQSFTAAILDGSREGPGAVEGGAVAGQ
jgi:hypothetical protein